MRSLSPHNHEPDVDIQLLAFASCPSIRRAHRSCKRRIVHFISCCTRSTNCFVPSTKQLHLLRRRNSVFLRSQLHGEFHQHLASVVRGQDSTSQATVPTFRGATFPLTAQTIPFESAFVSAVGKMQMVPMPLQPSIVIPGIRTISFHKRGPGSSIVSLEKCYNNPQVQSYKQPREAPNRNIRNKCAVRRERALDSLVAEAYSIDKSLCYRTRTAPFYPLPPPATPRRPCILLPG